MEKAGAPSGGPASSTIRSGSDADDVLGRRTLLALDDVELDALTLVQVLEALTLNRGVMDEAILATVLARDEAETLLSVEPLDRTLNAHVHLLQ
jgi:hypothetical protein